MNVLALDMSLTCAGYALVFDGELQSGVMKPPKGADRGPTRLAWFRHRLANLLCLEPAVVVLEGYSFGSHDRSTRASAELGGVVRLAIHDARRPLVEISPSSLKMLATGKGNAPKDEVLLAAVRRLNFPGTSNDEADAWWLRAAALLWYGLPGAPELPQTHTRALDKIEWPEIRPDTLRRTA